MGIDVIGRGVYTIPEAARYLGKNPRTLNAWFRSDQTNVLSSDYERSDDGIAISFLDLVDAKIACHFRSEGVSMREIREAYNALRDYFGVKHAFCHKDIILCTDGKQIYHHHGENVARATDGQLHAKEILEGHLRQLEYNPETALAERWRPMDGVVIDPARRFGKPVVEGVNVPTKILYTAYKANDEDEEYVAELYEVSPADVRAAVDYEAGLKKRYGHRVA